MGKASLESKSKAMLSKLKTVKNNDKLLGMSARIPISDGWKYFSWSYWLFKHEKWLTNVTDEYLIKIYTPMQRSQKQITMLIPCLFTWLKRFKLHNERSIYLHFILIYIRKYGADHSQPKWNNRSSYFK